MSEITDNSRCQAKCDKGSQCTRKGDHFDGYHLTDHGCVFLTEEGRGLIDEWFEANTPPEPFSEFTPWKKSQEEK